MRSISTINLSITENTECLIIKARTQAIDIKEGMCFHTVYHYTSFRLQLFEHLANIPSKE